MHNKPQQLYTVISIHAPLAGSDFIRWLRFIFCHISIHAPLAGSDLEPKHITFSAWVFQSTLPSRGATVKELLAGQIEYNFNPRSPRGERQWFSLLLLKKDRFQSTLPSRGATVRQGGKF